MQTTCFLGGPNEITFDERKRQGIQEKIHQKEFSRNMFDEAEMDILKHLRLNPATLTITRAAAASMKTTINRYSIFPLWKESSHLQDALKKAQINDLSLLLNTP